MHPGMQELRSYVTANEEARHDFLPEGFVRVDVTHSNLAQRWHDILLYLDMTIEQVKEKLYRKGGSSVSAMELFLRRGTLGETVLMADDTKTLRYYGCRNDCDIHIKDNDPFSISAGGALENLNLVEKYVMSDDTYDSRGNTLRAYIKKQRQQDPNFKLTFGNPQNPPKNFVQPDSAPENVAELFPLNARCQVSPGDRRGQIAFVGKINQFTYIGVTLDEPQGHNDGHGPDGQKYFDCPGEGYGCFSRPENVTVGDFPPVDPFASDDEI